MYRVTRLPSGLTIATAEMPHMASVSLGLWVGTGGRFESTPMNGVSHFIEHLLFKGTKRRSARDISVAIEGIGGYLNAFTAEENTCYYAKANARQLGDLLDVLMDMYLHARFAPGDIGKERSVIRDELALYLDQPQQHVLDLLNELLWPNHPLGRSLTGTFQTIESISRQDMLRYRKTHYVASNTLIAAAGRLTHEQLVQAVSRYARQVPQGRRPAYQPAGYKNGAAQMRLCRKKTTQTQLALGFPSCSRHDERRFAMRLLNTLLGENMSSRLFQVLREDHGLAYSVHSSLNLFDDVGSLVISAGLDLPKLPQALGLIAQELRRLRTRPPGVQELRRACDYLIGQLDLGLETTESQMMWVGEHMLAYGQILSPEQIKRHLQQVTPGQVRKAACDYLRPERVHLALISPRAVGSQVLQRLSF